MMSVRRLWWSGFFHLFCLLPGIVIAAEPSAPGSLIAQAYDSGLDMNHDTWNGMGVASDGKVYYVLCSESLDVGAQMFSFDPGDRPHPARGRSDRSLRRERAQGDPARQEPRDVRRIRRQALLRHAPGLLQHGRRREGRQGEEGRAARPATSPIRAGISWPTTWPGGRSSAWPRRRRARAS